MEKMVLVVDDSRSVRHSVSKALNLAGFKTTEAADGQEGLAVVDSSRDISMIICDINMPNMNGLEMLERVKSKPENKSLPILMLTTEGQVSLIKRAKQAGAVGWIVKPFDAKQLVQTVSHLTGEAPTKA